MCGRFHLVAVYAFVLLLLPRLASGAGEGGPEILSFGEGSEGVSIVRHGDLLSVFADQVPADVVLRHLQNIGGPRFSSIEPLTRPVTLALHRVRMEDVLRQMLEGYSFSYSYRGGRLVHVRVLHMSPGRQYKTPKPIETRAQWTRKEVEGTRQQ